MTLDVYDITPPQVLTKGVKPATPDAAKLGGGADQQQLALQHVRLRIARLVKTAHPKQVCCCCCPVYACRCCLRSTVLAG